MRSWWLWVVIGVVLAAGSLWWVGAPAEAPHVSAVVPPPPTPTEGDEAGAKVNKFDAAKARPLPAEAIKQQQREREEMLKRQLNGKPAEPQK